VPPVNGTASRSRGQHAGQQAPPAIALVVVLRRGGRELPVSTARQRRRLRHRRRGCERHRERRRRRHERRRCGWAGQALPREGAVERGTCSWGRPRRDRVAPAGKRPPGVALPREAP
jgi:hypothetical protein